MTIKLIVVFICTVLITTTFSVVGIMNKKQHSTSFEIYSNPCTYPIIETTSSPTNRGDMFKQLPRDPDDVLKNSYTSDSGTYDYLVFEDFWNLTNSICDIHWWGFSLKWFVYGWISCDPEGIKFDISFYEDNDSKPGSEVCSYNDIEYSVKGTGIMYEWFGGNLHEMLYFETQLEPRCELTEGWISIQSTYSPNGCSFLWMNSQNGDGNAYQYQPPLTQLNDDLAFILTDNESDFPDLECYGSLNWTNIKPGSLIQGNFTVKNIGGTDTLLDWEIVDNPRWGTWTFEPKNGEDLEFGIPVIINVTVVVPNKENSDFNGNIKIINTENERDNCTIPVYLRTPKNKKFNQIFFIKLTKQYSHMFPLIRNLMRF